MIGRSILVYAVLDLHARCADIIPPRWMWEWVPGMNFQDVVMRFFRFWQRWFYTTKAVVCIILGRVFRYLPGEHWYLGMIDVGMYDWYRTMTDWGEGAEWQAVCVGSGVIRGWRVGFYASGYP